MTTHEAAERLAELRWIEQLQGKRWSFHHTENGYKLCQDDAGELMPVADHERVLAEVHAEWKRMLETINRFHERNPPLAVKAQVAADLRELQRLREALEIQPDDNEPVTREWFESIGAIYQGRDLVLGELELYEFSAYSMVALPGSDHIEMKTRGQVRRMQRLIAELTGEESARAAITPAPPTASGETL